MSVQANKRVRVEEVVIESGASLSGAVLVGEWLPVAIHMPSAFAGDELAFELAVDGATYKALQDGASEYAVDAGASEVLMLPPAKAAAMLGSSLKLRSQTSGTNENQVSSNKTFTIILVK